MPEHPARAASLRRHPFRLRPHQAFWLALPAWLISLPLALVASDKPASARTDPRPNARRVQGLVDSLRARLDLASPVRASLVPENSRLVSVSRDPDNAGTFVLAVDEPFLAILTDTELEAVIAHELGHVWIFTHHPYLHTEKLANRIAMRVVSRSVLESVYRKMWHQSGSKGEVARFLDD